MEFYNFACVCQSRPSLTRFFRPKEIQGWSIAAAFAFAIIFRDRGQIVTLRVSSFAACIGHVGVLNTGTSEVKWKETAKLPSQPLFGRGSDPAHVDCILAPGAKDISGLTVMW